MKSKKIWVFSLILAGAIFVPATANAQEIDSIQEEQETVESVTVQEVKTKLQKMRFPVESVSTKKYDANMIRSACTWRSLTKGTYSRGKLTEKEKEKIMLTENTISVPKKLVVGLNINRACQTVIWVVKDKNSGEKKIKRIFPASTGKASTMTPKGKYKIYRETDRWHESTGFPGAMMYRPKYFKGGVALHGSITDKYVRPYPASAGCVRMLQNDIDRLWRNNVGVGTKVKVYGDWKY